MPERYRNVPNAASMQEHNLRLGRRAHKSDMALPLAAKPRGPLLRRSAHMREQQYGY
jgi:cytochrome c